MFAAVQVARLGKESPRCRLRLPRLAALVGGQLVGDGRLVILGAATLGDAGPGQITLVDQAEKTHLLEQCRGRRRRCAAGICARRDSGHSGR